MFLFLDRVTVVKGFSEDWVGGGKRGTEPAVGEAEVARGGEGLSFEA